VHSQHSKFDIVYIS